jgi:hypothetical protein
MGILTLLTEGFAAFCWFSTFGAVRDKSARSKIKNDERQEKFCEMIFEYQKSGRSTLK